MMSFLTTKLLLSALASPADGFAPSTAELKCGARHGGDPDMRDAVILLDHEVLEGGPEDARFLSTTADGWQARLEPKEDWSEGNHEPMRAIYRCFAHAGEVPAGWEKMRRDGGPGPVERKPECYEPGTLVREIWVG